MLAFGVVPIMSAQSPRQAARSGSESVARNRVGRPPAGDSAKTRRRILRAARDRFGRHGYDSTSNREVAAYAKLTAGTIYHYFSSKQELFVATHCEAQEIVLAAFSEAVAGKGDLRAKSVAILEQAIKLHTDDPSLAMFAAVSPVELQRHPELSHMLGAERWEMTRFFESLVRERQEDLAEDVDVMMGTAFLVAMTLGLALLAAVGGSLEAHRAGVESFERLIAGRFFASRYSGAAGAE